MIFEFTGRQMLAKQAERVESGVTQFEGDWPGLFIRGDDCGELAEALDEVMRWLDRNVEMAELRKMAPAIGRIGNLQMALGAVYAAGGVKNDG